MKFLSRVFWLVVLLPFLWPFLLNKKIKKYEEPLKLNKTIIIVNHYSNLDPMIIKKVFYNQKLVFVVDRDTRKKVWSRFLTWAFDCVYVKEDEVSIQAFKKLTSVLESNGTIVIFPEGVVNSMKMGFLEFQKGYTLLLRKSKPNVLPVYLYPSGTIFKKNRIVIDKLYSYDDYKSYTDLDELNMFFQSKMMDLSLEQ